MGKNAGLRIALIKITMKQGLEDLKHVSKGDENGIE